MEHDVALDKLRNLQGKDLRALADLYQVTVWREERKNKGWAGHVLERHLGLPINSAQSPNFGSWELKVIPLKRNQRGELQIKETMAITMIDPYNVCHTPFDQSHLFSKLRKAIICARIFESVQDERSILECVATFNLDEPAILNQIKADYELVRQTIQTKGFEALSGRMGILVQPRTKGPGHGSTSRAFYARTGLLTRILGLGRS
jgi:DNA mismatch repair protein MutH